MQQRNHKNKKSSKKKRNNDNKKKKQTNRKQTVEPFRPYLKKKKKKENVFSMQVEFFLRFEGLSLGLKYRQTKKGFGTIFRDRKTQIYLSITQS